MEIKNVFCALTPRSVLHGPTRGPDTGEHLVMNKLCHILVDMFNKRDFKTPTVLVS